MTKALRISVVGLLAVVAIAFAMLRVEARTGGGNASRLPAIEDRLGVQLTAITLTASPAVVDCAAGEPSTVTAFIVDASEEPVPDGTLVSFSAAAPATADPGNALTAGGEASSTITPAVYTADGITVIVSALDGQNQIRIDCESGEPPAPPECGDPNSPPSVSPPCPTATPAPNPSPPECADPNSPPSVSPPCPTATPANPSPPECDRGKPVSPPRKGPPCPKPTREPPSLPCKPHANAPRCRSVSPPEAVCANVTGGPRVTIRDAIAIALRVDRRYNARYDVNRDGAVDAYDVLEAIRQLGRRC